MRRWFALGALLLALPAVTHAQTFDARRMGMGGVILGGRQGGEGANVAYRALPRPASSRHSLSLPIGLVPLLQDPPSFDPDDPDFNAYRLANLVENPPWNLPLVEPATPSCDVALDVSRNALSVDLGDLGRVFPDGTVHAFAITNGPSLGFSVRRAFVALAPLVEVENELEVNEALRGVLREGAALGPNQRYAANDRGVAQAAAALHVGLALPLARTGDPARPTSALYAGVRAKILRGLAYGRADDVAAYETGDTLFGSSALDLRYAGHHWVAGPDGGGMGFGADAGAVWTVGRLEVGVGVDDVGTRLAWTVKETRARRDSVTGDFVDETVAEDLSLTSTVPVTEVANVAYHGSRWMVAADVRRGLYATTAHAGLERWVGPFALRGGASLDANRRTQLSGGLGIRLGPIGIDTAIATHNRNLVNERAVELGLGIGLLH